MRRGWRLPASVQSSRVASRVLQLSTVQCSSHWTVTSSGLKLESKEFGTIVVCFVVRNLGSYETKRVELERHSAVVETV